MSHGHAAFSVEAGVETVVLHFEALRERLCGRRFGVADASSVGPTLFTAILKCILMHHESKMEKSSQFKLQS